MALTPPPPSRARQLQHQQQPTRPLSPPRISERSPYPDDDGGVGINVVVSRIRDAFGFRSASGGSSSSSSGGGAGAGLSSSGAGGSSSSKTPVKAGGFDDEARAPYASSPGRSSISPLDSHGLGWPSALSSPSSSTPARSASTWIGSASAADVGPAARTLPRLITPSGSSLSHAAAGPSPLRSNFEASTSPISSHSGASARAISASPADDTHQLKTTAGPQTAASSSSRASSQLAAPLSAAPSSARSVPSLSARFMQPSAAAPVTSVEAASGRATFSAVDNSSPHGSPQSQPRSRHTSTAGSFSGAHALIAGGANKVPPFMRPRRGSNASVLSASLRANAVVGSSSLGSSPAGFAPSSASASAFPWGPSDTGFTSVPGFPLASGPTAGPGADSDNRSIRTTVSVQRNKSASKAIRKLVQGDVLSKDYWMDDDTATACYDCGRAFTTFTRRHHCRICGSIFCGRCASNLLRASRFGAEGTIRVCNLCLANLEEDSDEEDLQSISSGRAAFFPTAPTIQLDAPHALRRTLSQHHHHHHPHHHHQKHHHSPTLSGSPQAAHHPLPSLDPHHDPAFSPRPLTPDERFSAFLGGDHHGNSSGLALASPTMDGLEDQAPLRPAPFRSMIAADDLEGGGGGAPPSTLPALQAAGGGDSTSRAMAAWASADDAHSIRFAAELQRPDRGGRPPLLAEGDLNQSYISFPTTSDGGGGRADDDDGSGAATPFTSASRAGRFPRTESQARFDSNAPIPSPLAGFRYNSKYGQASSAAMLDDLLRIDGPAGRPRAPSVGEPSHAIAGHSRAHFRRILKEAIARVGLVDGAQWAETLETLLVKVSESVQPNVKAGDDIDLRTYVKLKKVPGGRIQDSEFLDGVAITKNVAHKKMVPERVLHNPRIMVLTLPLEYHRVEGQYVALTPVMAQERDYLRGLVQRIAAQRPHIVLASSPVSRLALEGLLAANIAVARSVKPTALEAIMRSTQAEDISSMDRLALEPKLGRCTTLRLTTFEHELIPGRRKTLMRFEGCHKEFGCTLVLRGGDLETLRKVKEVADFMVYAIYHLMLEMFLWFDAFGTSPPAPPTPTPPELPDVTLRSEYLTDLDSSPTPAATHAEEADPPAHSSAATAATRKRLHHERALSRRIYDALRPYHDVTLSISTSVAVPPPFPLAKMSRLDNTLHLLREARFEEEARLVLREEHKSKLLVASKASPVDQVAQDGIPPTPPPSQPPSLLLDPAPSAGDLFAPAPVEKAPSPVAVEHSGDAVAQSRPGTARPAPSPLPSLDSIIHSPEDVAQVSALAQIESEHATQTLLWDWYMAKYSHSLLPQDNQGIFYLAAEGCGEHGHCTPPHLEKVVYYQEDDQTLGQWIDRKADSAFQICACGKPKVEHYELLTHAETRLQVAMERCPVPVEEGKIMTWTYCLLCETIYAKAFLSEQSWKISFGKYLETSFYPNRERTSLPGACPHDFVRSHVRYFVRRNVTIRIHNEAIENFEVILPSSRPYVRAETKLLLKNAEITSCFQASNVYFDSVARKLNAYDGAMADPTKINDLRLKLGTLVDEVEAERRAFLQNLARSARESSPMDVLAINPVFNQLQGVVVRWDDKLAELEKSFFPSEKDVRRIAEGRIRRMFAGTDGLASERGGGSSIRSATVSEVDETEGNGETESDSNDSSTHSSEAWAGEASFPMASLSPSSSFSGQIDLPSTSTLLNETEQSQPASPPAPPLSTGGLSDKATPMNTGFRLPRPADHADSYFPDLSLSTLPPSEDTPRAPDDQEVDSTNDSDSTISAVPTSLRPASILMTAMSGLTPHDEEAPAAAEPPAPSPALSRIPRKTARTPSKVATLVQRFQQREGDEQLGDDEEEDKDLEAYRSLFKTTAVPRTADALTESEQEEESLPRPKPRRGLTDGSTRKKRMSASRTLSEQAKPGGGGEGSRLPVPKPWQPPSSPGDAQAPSSPEITKGAFFASPPTLTAPLAVPGRLVPAADDVASSSSPSSSHAGRIIKPRIAGKTGGAPSPAAQARQRGSSGSARVSTITRHFDRLSREAERDRQKRLSLARGRRARPVTVAKAVVTSLDLRDAVKDESDSDVSSGADDEEDGASPLQQQGKRARRTSPSSPTTSPLAVKTQAPIAHPLQGAEDGQMATTSPSTTPPQQHPGPAPSVKQTPPPKALQDSVQLELGPFEKLAPLASMPPTPLMTGGSTSTSAGGRGGGHMSESEMSSAGPERSSILKTLSSLWAFTDADLAPLEYPLNAGTYMFEGSRIIMREEEPMSIIAFALDSPMYKDKLKTTRAAASSAFSPRSLAHSVAGDTSQDWTLVGHGDAVQDLEDSILDGEGNHLQWALSSGGTSFFCRLLFLERFDNLRTRCGLSGEDGFIESLARCVKWESSGGKSKSAFLKTKDDRFVAKELSRQEMDDFSRFAPAYFTYMADCLDNDRPTALAKIFGVYKMGFTSSRVNLRMNVMIMENLFYDKRFQVIYDLKGNQRGRHIEPSGKAGEVLLDANLEKTLWNHPLYLRDYSKKILRSALHNDTKFLSEQGVMDYSVVCAVDQNQSEITAGIIDYIRTFTWDKKLESWVKDSAFFPSKGVGEPTIVGPKQYKNRFRASMEKYLTVIPDFWMHPEHPEHPDDPAHEASDPTGVPTDPKAAPST